MANDGDASNAAPRVDAENQLAIKRLVYQFAIAIDEFDAGALAKCLSPDAKLLGYGIEAQGDLAGELIAAERAARLPSHAYSLTFVMNLWHDVRGDAASGRSYSVVSSVAGPMDKLIKRDTHIRFDDELVKRDGRWQFSERRYQPLFVSEAPVIDFATFEAEAQKTS